MCSSVPHQRHTVRWIQLAKELGIIHCYFLDLPREVSGNVPVCPACARAIFLLHVMRACLARASMDRRHKVSQRGRIRWSADHAEETNAQAGRTYAPACTPHVQTRMRSINDTHSIRTSTHYKLHSICRCAFPICTNTHINMHSAHTLLPKCTPLSTASAH